MEQNPQSISIVGRVRSIRVLFESFVVEVGDVCAFSQLLLDFFIKGYRLADFGDATLYVDVLDVETCVKRFD